MEAMYKFTTIGRPIDPAYPTNRLILIVTVVAALMAGVIALIVGAEVNEAIVTGGLGGLATLVGWIIGRELDPDNDYSAFAAAGFAWIVAFFFSAPDFLILMTLNLLLRIVNRSVGLPAKLGDTIMVTVLVLLSVFLSYWAIGLVAAVAFSIDAIAKNPHPPHLVAAAVSLVSTIAYLLTNNVEILNGLTLIHVLVAAVISAAYCYAILDSRVIRCKADATGEVLHPARVQLAMVIGLFAAWMMLLNGNAGFVAVVPLWATLLAIPLYRIVTFQYEPKVSLRNHSTEH